MAAPPHSLEYGLPCSELLTQKFLLLLGSSQEQERCLLSFVWWRQQLSKKSRRPAAGICIHATWSSHLIPLGGGLKGLVTFLIWCISPFCFSVISLKGEKGCSIFHLKGNKQYLQIWPDAHQAAMLAAPASTMGPSS